MEGRGLGCVLLERKGERKMRRRMLRKEVYLWSDGKGEQRC